MIPGTAGQFAYTLRSDKKNQKSLRSWPSSKRQAQWNTQSSFPLRRRFLRLCGTWRPMPEQPSESISCTKGKTPLSSTTICQNTLGVTENSHFYCAVRRDVKHIPAIFSISIRGFSSARRNCQKIWEADP